MRSAWCDLYAAICNAEHLIYITGWSIYDKITLVRDPLKPMQPSECPTLGAPVCSSPQSVIPWLSLHHAEQGCSWRVPPAMFRAALQTERAPSPIAFLLACPDI